MKLVVNKLMNNNLIIMISVLDQSRPVLLFINSASELCIPSSFILVSMTTVFGDGNVKNEASL